MKSIILKPWEIRAILEGRKTTIRRVVKGDIPSDAKFGYTRFTPDDCVSCIGTWDGREHNTFIKYPYSPGKGHRYGDVLYVREAWKSATIDPAGGGYALQDIYLYKADEPINTSGMMVEGRWHPSIHMPREAARIFLRVKDVRVERLQDITNEQVIAEGIECRTISELRAEVRPALFEFQDCWDSTIKPADRAIYGWAANPWVWVIKFEKISKEEAARA